MMLRLTAVLCLLLMSGCLRHRPAEIFLPVDTPSQYLGNQGSAGAEVAIDRWWLAFEDMTLNRLVTELFVGNLELEQGFARLDQVESLLRINRSAQLPNLAAGGKMDRSQQPGLIDDFVGDSQQLSLAAGFELDLWGKLAKKTRAAQLDLTASHDDLQTLYLGLSAKLVDLYFLGVEQRAQLALTDSAIASFSDTAQRVENRYRLGLVTAVDMYQAQQNLYAAQASRHLFAARLASAEHALAILLGKYPQKKQNNNLDQLPVAPDLFAVGTPVDLVSQRPDLRAALKRVEAADARVAAAIAERFPTISLAASYGSLRQSVTAGLIEGEFWNLLGNLTMPVIDGGRRRAEVRRQQAVLREALAVYQQKVLGAFQEVEDALINNYATEQRAARLGETAQATSATLRLATERYLAGLTDYLPVLTSQRVDVEVRSRLLDAQRQLLADRVSLARALGGKWMKDEMALRLQTEKDKGITK